MEEQDRKKVSVFEDDEIPYEVRMKHLIEAYRKDITRLEQLTRYAKGLEEENVIIVNSENIPSKIKSEKILRLIQNDKEYIPYEEERRIFYVALTRTKNKVYILVNKPSIFIKEIIHDYKVYIEIKKKH